MTKDKMGRVVIPQALIDELEPEVRRIPRMSVSAALRDSLRRWVDELEAEEYRCLDKDGTVLIKLPGEAFPKRTGELNTGRPLEPRNQNEETKGVPFRWPEDLAERVLNAVFWTSKWLSYVAEDQLRIELERLKGIR